MSWLSLNPIGRPSDQYMKGPVQNGHSTGAYHDQEILSVHLSHSACWIDCGHDHGSPKLQREGGCQRADPQRQGRPARLPSARHPVFRAGVAAFRSQLHARPPCRDGSGEVGADRDRRPQNSPLSETAHPDDALGHLQNPPKALSSACEPLQTRGDNRGPASQDSRTTAGRPECRRARRFSPQRPRARRW
jgi:hypothetical protein